MFKTMEHDRLVMSYISSQFTADYYSMRKTWKIILALIVVIKSLQTVLYIMVI